MSERQPDEQQRRPEGVRQQWREQPTSVGVEDRVQHRGAAERAAGERHAADLQRCADRSGCRRRSSSARTRAAPNTAMPGSAQSIARTRGPRDERRAGARIGGRPARRTWCPQYSPRLTPQSDQSRALVALDGDDAEVERREEQSPRRSDRRSRRRSARAPAATAGRTRADTPRARAARRAGARARRASTAPSSANGNCPIRASRSPWNGSISQRKNSSPLAGAYACASSLNGVGMIDSAVILQPPRRRRTGDS